MKRLRFTEPLGATEVEALLRKLPRENVAYIPTPLEECSRLSKFLGGPSIFIKRDDLTGLATGGNKARMLEFLLGDAQEKGTDILIASAPTQSNHCRMTAAAGAKLGIKVILLLRHNKLERVEGNLLLDDLLGADLRMVKVDDLHETSETVNLMQNIAIEYRDKGYNPYFVDLRKMSVYAAIAYVDALREIYQQLENLTMTADHIFITTCAGGTHGGLILGSKLMNLNINIIGSLIGSRQKEEVYRLTHQAIEDATGMLNMESPIEDDDIVIIGDYAGEGVGDVTQPCKEAIRLVAEKEGILLDPVYTGKTMAAIIDYIRKGVISSDETVIMWHTGGTPSIFVYGDTLASRTIME